MGETARTLPSNALPPGFAYPPAFLHYLHHGPADLDRWFLLDRERAMYWRRELIHLYPARALVPFAKHVPDDDLACFEVGCGEVVHIVHAYASDGWEARGRHADFWTWLRTAVDEMIEEASRDIRAGWEPSWDW